MHIYPKMTVVILMITRVAMLSQPYAYTRPLEINRIIVPGAMTVLKIINACKRRGNITTYHTQQPYMTSHWISILRSKTYPSAKETSPYKHCSSSKENVSRARQLIISHMRTQITLAVLEVLCKKLRAANLIHALLL